jgi:hypothetical protein
MKKLVKLSLVTALAVSSYASTSFEDRIIKLEQELAKTKVEMLKIKKHDATDNIKWNVNFRTVIDSIHYTHASGKESSNPDLLTNRLWLEMAYAPSDNLLFRGKLSYFKAYGDTANHAQSNTNPGYANFDWVTNENATDNNLKVKEAYWYYKNNTFLGSNTPWTMSIGRRPSTDGLGINLRENMKENSPLSHTVNVEFDGLSSRFNLDKVTGVDGMWWKLCVGRGLTNAKQRFQNDGADYAIDDTQTKDNNMYGFIFVPYDNGQYSIHTNWARAEHMIGFDNSGLMSYQKNRTKPSFKDSGDLDLLTAMFKAEGIGDGINDFLDDTTFFVSYARSITYPSDVSKASTGLNAPYPTNEGGMLGSTNSETGYSTWVGLNMPSPINENDRIGIEWNQGSKYWRSVTYGEDTMIGSKIATRGTVIEVYYNKPLMKGLNLNIRYTEIDYDYTGSNTFFGADGTPMTMTEAQAQGQDPVKKATDLRAYISYIF